MSHSADAYGRHARPEPTPAPAGPAPYPEPVPYPEAAYQEAPYPDAPYQGAAYQEAVAYPEAVAYQEPAAQPGPVDPASPPPGYANAFDRPKGQRRGLKITLGVLAVLAVVCAVGGVIVGKPFVEEYPATITATDEIAGFGRSNTPQLVALSEQLSSELKTSAKLSSSAAGVYHKDGEAPEKLVIVAAGAALVLTPQKELDKAFDTSASSGLAVVGVKAVEAGPLGGTAECGTSVTGGLKVAVCGWADHGSVGFVYFFDRTMSESAKLLLDFRKAVQHR